MIDQRIARYSFLVGYAPRNDEEEAELWRLQEELRADGRLPAWAVVPRVDLDSIDLTPFQLSRSKAAPMRLP